MQLPKGQRLDWIDYTKGLSILGIVLFHFFQNYPYRFPIVESLYQIGTKVGYAAVDIFFIIAGFNISYSLCSKYGKDLAIKSQLFWTSWLKTRLIRLYPTYWLSIIFSLIIYYVFRGYINIKSWLDLGLIITGITTYTKFKLINPGFWFFSVILQCFLITPLIFYVSQSKKIIILFLGIILGIATKILCLIFKYNLFFFFLQNNFVGSYIFEFCLGLYWGLVYLKSGKFRKIDHVVVISVFSIGLYIYLSMLFLNVEIFYRLGFDLVFSPLLFLICYWLLNMLPSQQGQKSLSYYIAYILGLLGIYSYQIFLIHQPLFFVFQSWGQTIVNVAPDNIMLLLSLIIVLTVLVVYVWIFTQVDLHLHKIWDKLKEKLA